MVSEDAPTVAPGIVASFDSQLLGLLGEDAEVGPQLEDVAGVSQDRPGAGGVVQRQVGAHQLEQCLDGQGRDRVGEQRPQPGGLGEVLAGPGAVAPVQGRAGHHHMDEGGVEVVVQGPFPADPQGPRGQGLGPLPVAVLDRHQRPLGQGGGGGGQGTGVGGDLHRTGQHRVGPLDLALQQEREPLQEQGRSPARCSPGPVPRGRSSRRRPSAPRRRGRAAPGSWPASSRRCCRRGPSRWPSPARRRPPSARPPPACPATPGARSRARRPPGSAPVSPRSSNHASQRLTVSTRPPA